MEPVYGKEQIKIKRFKKTQLYPVYFPDKLLTISKTFLDKINKLFSYEVIYLHPNENNINDIKRIIEFRLCLNQKHRLYSSNCFNQFENLKVTFIYTCHTCKQIYLLSGRYDTKDNYMEAYNFFKIKNKF